MKKILICVSLVLLIGAYIYADNLRKAADFFELLLIEEFEKAETLTSQEAEFTPEKLKEISDEWFTRYGYLVSYLSYEADEVDVSFIVQMERVQLFVNVSFDETDKIVDLAYQPAGDFERGKTQINIQTIPDNASVSINGNFQGWTPLVLEEYPGVHEIEIRKNGFLPLTQTMQLNDGDTVKLDCHLIPAVTIHQIDYMKAKSLLLNSFDRGGWFKADWVSENISNIGVSKDNVIQGTQSLKVDFRVDEPSEVIVQYPYSIEPKNLMGAADFFIDVFLDYEGEAILSIALQTGEQWEWIESDKHTLKGGMHYVLPIQFTNLQDFDTVNVVNLKLFIPNAESSGSVYYDNLRYFIEDVQRAPTMRGTPTK